MKIQIGEVYLSKVTNQKALRPNKTRKYLLPCLTYYGKELMNYLNSVFKVAVGIGDIIVNKSGLKYEKHIFILIDTTTSPQFFLKFIDWIRRQENIYEDDYVYDNIQESRYHMVVLKFPEKYWESFDTFKKGEYSKMFIEEDINSIFDKYPTIKKVFIKDHDYKVNFTERVNRIFGTTITPEEYDGELELPPSNKTEVFNDHLIK